MARILFALTAVAVILLGYVVRSLLKGYAIRKKMHNLPGPPHSMLWGHLKAMGEQVRELPRRMHPHSLPLRIMKKYNTGSFFYLDTWPFGDPMVVVMDPTISQQLSVEYTTLKHPQLGEFLTHLAGPDDMVSVNGAIWKKWRSIFNPGFATTHLMSLVAGIVDDGLVYSQVLDEHAASDKVFRLEEVTTRLTIDVIGKVVLDLRFNMQRGENACIEAMREQVHLLPNEGSLNPWKQYNPSAIYRRWRNDRIMTQYIGKVLDERFASKNGASIERAKRSRTIMDLALDSYLTGEGQDEKKAGDGVAPQLDEAFKQGAITQIRVFLFAGHDTTSSTICYALYMLRKHPACLQRIREEHQTVLGSIAETPNAIKSDPYILNKLEYTTAVIKETLRLWPAASAPRMGEPNLFIRDPKTGESFPTEGLMIWLVHYGTQRNPAIWSDPDAFQPERFLPENAGKIPEGAFRAFEMGARNCIGQNLAMIEARIILALVCRKFDVDTAFDRLDEVSGDGSFWASDDSFRGGKQDVDGEEMYQVLVGAAKPREGMPARITRSGWEKS